MSYNNYVDADAARRAAYDFAEPCVAIIKHANPCGIAVGADIAEAHRKAHACDPVSAFGGVIATNRPVTAERWPSRSPRSSPRWSWPRASRRRARDPDRARRTSGCCAARRWRTADPVESAAISGGVLVQTRRPTSTPTGDDPANWTLATGEAAADERRWPTWRFAWRACRAVKSNAILLADDGATVGVGMGQVNRVDSCRLAVVAGRGAGAPARSPPPTRSSRSPTACRCCSTPACGRSCSPAARSATSEVVEAAKAAGVTMYFTGTRHFAH